MPLMMITINLSAALDAELRSAKQQIGDGANASREFHALLTTHGLKPVPLFPDARVAGFAPIWHLTVSEQEAQVVIARLTRTPGVDAAYGKPQDELPSPP